MTGNSCEAQERRAADARQRFGPAAKDLAAWIRECDPDTASDYQDAVEQWLRDHGAA